MAFNKYKKPPSGNKSTMFTWIESKFQMGNLFESGIPVSIFPKILFIATLGIFYIANSHYTDKTIRKIEKLKVEVEDLRADYTTLKADYMVESKQSEVAKKVDTLGLKESIEPPYKIELVDK